MRKPQVDPNYVTMPYLSRERWISFWYQILEVTTSRPTSVLEIGPGPGIASLVLTRMSLRVTTFDIDERLKPHVVGDVTKLPLVDQSFDCILMAEVLEHIPFAEMPHALSELSRVAKRTLVITLPHYSLFAPSIALKIFPFIPRASKVFPVSFPVPHRFDGQHYWEIGKKGTPFSLIKEKLVRHTGFILKKDYLIEENPFHHVFVLNRE